MTKYKVIRSHSIDDLSIFVDKVNEAITEGWHPIGGITIDRYNHLYQAMILEL